MIALFDFHSANLEALPDRQQATAIVVSVLGLLLVLELVRRRKLREEYSLLWIVTGVIVVTVVAFEAPVIWISQMIGAANPASTLFLGALIFLMLVALQFSIRLSKLTWRNKSLSQRIALLEEEVRRVKGEPVTPVAKKSEQERRKDGAA